MSSVRITRFGAICVALLLGCSAANAAVNLPSGGQLEKVDFERHVMGLFSKAGCNNGSCHGSFQGKNGFRLSLFGYEPARDFAALTRDIHGRRTNTLNPDSSLLLTKAVGSVKHDGGMRFSKDSWQYQIMRKWIEQGCDWTKGSGEVASLEMTPKEYVFAKPGETTQIKIVATYTDGSKEDITPFCDFRIQDDAIATQNGLGQITGVKPGDSGLVAFYRGKVIAARVLVPMPSSTEKFPAEVNFIDREVFEKLRKLNMVPSNLASDSEFLRRIYIDTIGSLPTPAEARSFLADTRADKRERKIDELLRHPLHAALWATKFSDVTGNNTDALENPVPLKTARSQQWHDWFRKRLAENMPYDQIVKGIMVATSRDHLSPADWVEHADLLDSTATKLDTAHYAERESLDLFWRRQVVVPPDQWGQKVAAAFLGVRLECAECHKHPTDRWTQADYRSFANFFTQISFTQNQYSSPDVKKAADALNVERRGKTTGNNNQINLVRELFVADAPTNQRLMTNPETGAILKPKALGGPEMPFQKGKDIREDLFSWMSSPDNPFFARSFVNRVWAHYYGVGLVDPVDDFSLANPPSNGRLLDSLAKEFTESKYDIRKLEKAVLMSRTYQTTSTPNTTNRFDRLNFARAYVRPMMAEVVVDVLNSALGVEEDFKADALPGKKMIEVGASRFLNNPSLSFVLRLFGRPPRTTACDCERATEPALPQTLYRMTDPNVTAKLNATSNRLSLALKSKMTDDEILDELFLATLTRLPSSPEREAFNNHKANEKTRSALFTNTLWALINTREFVLNH